MTLSLGSIAGNEFLRKVVHLGAVPGHCTRTIQCLIKPHPIAEIDHRRDQGYAYQVRKHARRSFSPFRFNFFWSIRHIHDLRQSAAPSIFAIGYCSDCSHSSRSARRSRARAVALICNSSIRTQAVGLPDVFDPSGAFTLFSKQVEAVAAHYEPNFDLVWRATPIVVR
jgi:hypothetical protein